MLRELKNKLVGAALAAALAAPGSAFASYALQIVDTGFICNDNTACDLNPDVNVITMNAGVPGFTSVNIESSFTNTPGGPSFSILDLNWTLVAGSATSGDITILASATGFTFPASGDYANLSTHVGGTGNPGGAFSVTADGWISSSNILFDTTADVYSGVLGPYSTPGFTGGSTVSYLSSTPYSITDRIQVHLAAGASTTGDLQVVAAPEPSTLVLFAGGLLAFGFYLRRRRQRA